mmetsp:Transcript_13371/g.31350  ORF Transcript_13371/g.31350 Transcript_13371/m.31350 type:complete len:798 (-) Transcript_13371:202-2595(-)|eukprot:CAMPEP_0178385664 /NCGR_PEP_ID=MMETSP0689_2-20121128/8146_1 /TAXON_ID=160604 /ORGANISM="Amphidinium massartii, Strain CS-259" /LENGTH=797 /DNA_ID=CAMNT_0020005947 /DNA_START=41 /DNA_END=2434 /DNA_ORIENTATION=+
MGEAQSLQDGSTSDEGALLSKLVTLLNDRQCLLLSDLGALLPGHLRQRVKEQGGLRSWLQRYPGVFSVTGQPGQESVTLIFGASADPAEVVASLPTPPPPAGEELAEEPTITIDDLEQQLNVAEEELQAVVNEGVQPMGDGLLGGSGYLGGGPAFECVDDDPSEQCAIQLRGLPFRATAEDVYTFLGEFAVEIAGAAGIQLMLNRDGRPSGFARVQFSEPEVAKRCREKLHLKAMDERYVEVFLYSERPSKGKNRRAVVEEYVDGMGPPPIDISGVTRESVVDECREQMAEARRRQQPGQLMSMLGVALSAGARAYLKANELGLKSFLAQYPEEFQVEGGKGCEFVTYTPATINLNKALEPGPGPMDGAPFGMPLANGQTGSASRANSVQGRTRRNNLETPIGSPNPRHGDPSHSAARGLATPSDWGTPAPGSHMPWGPTPESLRGCPGVGGAGTAPPWGMPPWGAAGFGGPPFMSPPDAGGWPGAWSGNPMAAAGNPLAAAAGMNGLWPPGFGDIEGSWPPAGLWPPNTEEGEMAANGGYGADAQPPAPGLQQPPTEVSLVQGLEGPHMANGGQEPALIRLRGLPFSANEQDIFSFFSTHDVVDRISDGPKAVSIILRSNGKSSGQAMVQMRSRTDAEFAQRALDGKYMGQRYIEVFYPADSEPLPGGAKAAIDAVRGGGHQKGPHAQANHYGGYPGAWPGSWGGNGAQQRTHKGGAAPMPGSAGDPSEASKPCWEAIFDHMDHAGMPGMSGGFPWGQYPGLNSFPNGMAPSFPDAGGAPTAPPSADVSAAATATV